VVELLACAGGNTRALNAFAAELRRVEDSKPVNAPVEGGQRLRPPDLEGLPRTMVLQKLGDPRPCSFDERRPGETRCDRWVYYKFPSDGDWAGGGRELELYYDSSDTCVRGQWYITM
jgi:hypothetical protein